MIQALLVSNILCLFISTEVSQYHTKKGPLRTPLDVLRVKIGICTMRSFLCVLLEAWVSIMNKPKSGLRAFLRLLFS